MPALANPKHERFAQLVGTGMKATPAYREAFGATGTSASVEACNLKKRPNVSLRIREIEGKFEAHMEQKTEETLVKKFLTLERKRELLAEFALNKRFHVRERIKSIELDAKLAGELKGDNGTQVSLTVVVSHAQVLDRVRAMSPVLAGLSMRN